MSSPDVKHAVGLFALGAAAGFLVARAKHINDAKLEAERQALQRQPSMSRRSSRHSVYDEGVGSASVDQRRLFIMISGKRAAGKDYTAKRIKAALWSRGIGAVRVSMGDESKRLYADETPGVDFYRLLKDREFKEQHRDGITRLFRARIAEDSEYFHSTALRRSDATPAPVVLITDCRFKFDLDFFARYHDILAIRINANDAARRKRGWTPNASKDADDTETALDHFKGWDLVYDSSRGDDELLAGWITNIVVPLVKTKMDLGQEEDFVDDEEVN